MMILSVSLQSPLHPGHNDEHSIVVILAQNHCQSNEGECRQILSRIAGHSQPQSNIPLFVRPATVFVRYVSLGSLADSCITTLPDMSRSWQYYWFPISCSTCGQTVLLADGHPCKYLQDQETESSMRHQYCVEVHTYAWKGRHRDESRRVGTAVSGWYTPNQHVA